MKKSDIRYHRLGYGSHGVPAVNVKVYASPTDAIAAQVARDNGDTSGAFTPAWINANLSDDQQNAWWGSALENGWEYLTESVNAENVFGRKVAIYSEGRSSGWAYVEGIDCEHVDAWDAIALARWAKFDRFCRETVADIPYQYLSAVYLNVFEPIYSAAIDRAERAMLRDAGGF